MAIDNVSFALPLKCINKELEENGMDKKRGILMKVTLMKVKKQRWTRISTKEGVIAALAIDQRGASKKCIEQKFIVIR